jgi:hypothetical protein
MTFSVTGEDWVAAIRTASAAGGFVGVEDRATESVVCARVADTPALSDTVASSLPSATVDTGAGVFFRVGLTVAGSAAFFVPRFGFAVAVGESSSEKPFLSTTPGGALCTAPSSVAGVPSDWASPGSGVEAAALEAEPVDAAALPASSAHAMPLLQPVITAAATPKATAKPPTRPAYALPGMRHVYLLRRTGTPQMRRIPQFAGGHCGKFSSAMWTALIRVAIAGTAMSLTFAPPAAAGTTEYLQAVAPFYTNFSADQLLSEGTRVCAALRSGVIAPNAVLMVQKDLGASIAAAGDIVSAAVVNLDC